MTAITLSQILAGKVAQYLAWDNQKQQRGARSLRFFTPAIAFLACHAREQRPKEQWRLQQEVRGQSHGDRQRAAGKFCSKGAQEETSQGAEGGLILYHLNKPSAVPRG